MDEVHLLLDTLPTAFHSNRSAAVKGTTNQYVEPRSYFSFLANFLREYGLETVWAGTHLRIGHISRISSNASINRPVVFTDFNYLTSTMIEKLLDEWVVIRDVNLKMAIASQLQGRPRIFMSFIQSLSKWPCSKIDDKALKQVFDNFVQNAARVYKDLWESAAGKTLTEFAGDPEKPPRTGTVLSLLEDLLFNASISDSNKLNNDPHWYKCLVSTGLVMIGGESGKTPAICEPLVVRAGFDYMRTKTSNDIPASTVIHRFIKMDADEATRGKGVESICIVRIREEFWLCERFWKYFPDDLVKIIKSGGIATPIGLDDCRTGDASHKEKLRNSFLAPDARNIVRPQSAMSCADVVYGHFTFHLKSTWTDVRGGKIVLSTRESDKNIASIDKTWSGDDIMTERVNACVPWVRILFEFPTNQALKKEKMPDIVEREGSHRVTITAGIHSEFTELFFGGEFVDLVKRLTSSHE
jgi:hypothetical protein